MDRRHDILMLRFTIWVMTKFIGYLTPRNLNERTYTGVWLVLFVGPIDRRHVRNLLCSLPCVRRRSEEKNMSLDITSHPGRSRPDELVPSRYAVRVGEIDVLVVSDGVLPLQPRCWDTTPTQPRVRPG